MFTQSIHPVIATLGPLQFRWYGLFYATGWLIFYFLGGYLIRKKKLLSEEHFQEFFIYALIAVVIGARLGSVISDYRYYLAHPADILAVWNGGLAFHGGLAAAVLFGWWYCTRHKARFLALSDIATVPAALALALGRVGNFINGEFIGTPTTLPWGVYFPGHALARHPVQLYASVHMLILAGIALWLLRRNLPDGSVLAFFLVGYGVGRFGLEYLKDPLGVTHIGSLTWGQFWCIPMIVVGLGLAYYLFATNKLRKRHGHPS